MSLYNTHRPDCLEDVEGNDHIKERLSEFLFEDDVEIPRTIMFTGDSGTGKTTLSRIISESLEAEYQEYNCANIRGLDDFREIVKAWSIKPLGGGWRVVVLDEVHQLPAATQNLLLKPLEDGTSSTIIILCTTNPEKLIKTIRTRPVAFKCECLSDSDMSSLLKRVCSEEGIKIKKSVAAAIIDSSEGSGRKALTTLESVVGLSSELALKKISSSSGDYPEEVVILCRALFSGNKKLGELVAIAKKVEGDPETIRRAVLGYACACIPKMGTKAYKVADAFRDNWADTGKQGLILSIYEAWE